MPNHRSRFLLLSSSSRKKGGSVGMPDFWRNELVWEVGAAIVTLVVLAIVVYCVCRKGQNSRSAPVFAVAASDRELHAVWTQEDEESILCDATECMHLFAQYRVHPVTLGDGTTARVLKVTRNEDNRTFAMKRYSFKAETPQDRLQFEWMDLFKEYWLLRHVDHPNIIHIEEVFISFFDPFLPGASLSSFRSSGELRENSTEYQVDYYPDGKLCDAITPFLQTAENREMVARIAESQRNMSRRYCFILMSYIPNGTLADYVDRRRDDALRAGSKDVTVLSEEEALYLACQVYQALDYLHNPHRRSLVWSAARFSEPSSRRFAKPESVVAMSTQHFSSSSFGASDAVASAGARVLTEDGPILHRDVKPDNILVEDIPGFQVGQRSRRKFPSVRLVLTDFGFADVYRRGQAVAHKGAPPIYAAPEVSRRNPSPASDVFSAGVVMFELLSAKTRDVSRSTFGNFATNIMRTTFVEKQTTLLLSTCGVSPAVSQFLFTRVLVVDPLKRCTAGEAVEWIQDFLRRS